jgi:phosphatidylglycerophosphate synthase
MVEFLKDKVLLEPLVNRTDFLYTRLNITPNEVTLFNNLVITPCLLYCWFTSRYGVGLVFLLLRLLLDGVDGFLARKHHLSSLEGEIYDHAGDSVFIGFVLMAFLFKLGVSMPLVCACGMIAMIVATMFNFNPGLQKVSTATLGAGGSYDAYCTMSYLVVHLLLWCVDR